MKRKEVFEISHATETFQSILGENTNLEHLSNDSNVLILYSNEKHKAFYSGTLDILDFINETEELNAEVCSSDEDYIEIALHSADFWIGTFIIQSIVVPVFVGVITSYIYDKLKANNNDNVSIKIIVENEKGKSKAVSFEGKVEDFQKAVKAINKLKND